MYKLPMFELVKYDYKWDVKSVNKWSSVLPTLDIIVEMCVFDTTL